MRESRDTRMSVCSNSPQVHHVTQRDLNAAINDIFLKMDDDGKISIPNPYGTSAYQNVGISHNIFWPHKINRNLRRSAKIKCGFFGKKKYYKTLPSESFR